jgi:hypothetical protein
MSFDIITDEQIRELISMPKVIINPNAKFVEQCGHTKKNYVVEGDLGYSFILFIRQNLREGMSDDFSCGLIWKMPSGDQLTLCRYNGSTHPHKNILDKTRLTPNCHIHLAREDYIQAGLAAEGHATITDRYKTLDGALHCLVHDCNIANLSTQSDLTQIEIQF